ncbi:hypothetical protein WJX84_010520 [Apatococcus fuscideae]|uniref:Uncharacterized protein n=1 Tax=Apatococcus fuscideae TaxID=2026836 RepID=A0AAW1THQ2_9CHLO
MPPRPSGTDGTDHAYRMTIENRYRRIADQKRTVRGLELASVALVLIRTGYQQLPKILQGGETPAASLPLLITAAASLLFFRLASAKRGGIQEGGFVLAVFSIISLVMAGQVLLDMFNQHKVYLGEKQRAFIVSAYLNSKLPIDPDLWLAAVRYVEGMLEIRGVPTVQMSDVPSSRMREASLLLARNAVATQLDE